jgi:small subunit ribosomal protein S17
MTERGLKRILVGTVVSDKMDKTVVVRVDRMYQDPTYKKYVRRYTKFMAHDEDNGCVVGDKVRIVEHRPLSKQKRWKVQAKLTAGAAK